MSGGYLAEPSDFFVEELPLYPATGEGGHTFVFVEKRLMNTEDVAEVLARAAGVSARDVGYAGRKDRAAVTRQCLSVPGLEPEAALALEAPGLKVLLATRHPHKLRTGQLAGNRFVIRVRGVSEETIEHLAVATERVLRAGMPNRFGTQRFGREGANIAAGQRILAIGRAGRDRRRARFLVSALQAAVFNEVLEQRTVPLDRVERGDVARRSDSGGLFLVEDEVLDNERAARFEISATGPIFGTKMEQPTGTVALREHRIMTELGVDLAWLSAEGGLRIPGVRLRGGRRPFRVPLAEFEAVPGAPDEAGLREVLLRFVLPAGAYATVAMQELLGFEPERTARSPDP